MNDKNEEIEALKITPEKMALMMQTMTKANGVILKIQN